MAVMPHAFPKPAVFRPVYRFSQGGGRSCLLCRLARETGGMPDVVRLK